MLPYNNIYFYFQCFESGPTVLKAFTACQGCFTQEIFSEAEPNDVKFSFTTFLVVVNHYHSINFQADSKL